MLEFAAKHPDKLIDALLEHLEIVLITLIISLLLAAALTVISMKIEPVSRILIQFFSVIYSVPSLALFALLIPVTGLGMKTAIIVLVIYNQYLLLRNFISGLNEVDPAVVEAARGLGMTEMQILMKIRLPLAKRALFAGVHLAAVSTIGIATIAASINAGGLGTLLFDGLRTMNTDKILWGSILSAGLAIVVNGLLGGIEKRIGRVRQ
ncbi:MAG: ABC transporter permease [Hespellia sp.]|nr:ABC transporter permease [Hespellia sp.]